MEKMQVVTIYTDGGCQGNPGPGGWAAVLTCGPYRLEISGGNPATTNNRMELSAAIAALLRIKDPSRVLLYTDSQYVRNGVTQWIHGWKRKGWVTANRQPVKNADLWKALDASTTQHQIDWRWVKGHAGNAGNERCDQLATQAIAAVRQRYTPAQLLALVRARSPSLDD